MMDKDKSAILESVREKVGNNIKFPSQIDFTQKGHYCPRYSFNISKSNNLIVTHQN